MKAIKDNKVSLESDFSHESKKRRSIQGWPSDDAHNSEDTLNFSLLAGVRPMVETFPLEEAPAAYARMMSNKVRFRAVLKIG